MRIAIPGGSGAVGGLFGGYLARAAPMIGGMLSPQNGWGNAPRIASVARDRVPVGLAYHSATLLARGKVRHPGSGMTYIGEPGGKPSQRLEKAAETFRGACFEVTVSRRTLDEVWKKLALNACTLPTAALLRFFAHELDRVRRHLHPRNADRRGLTS